MFRHHGYRSCGPFGGRPYGKRRGCWPDLTGGRLHRDPLRGKVAGVCAGIADWAGVEPFIIRLGVLAAVLLFSPVVLVAYAIAALALPVRLPPAPMGEQSAMHSGSQYTRRDTRREWEASPASPAGTVLDAARGRLASCERRVADLEAYVATREFELNRAIRDLKRR